MRLFVFGMHVRRACGKLEADVILPCVVTGSSATRELRSEAQQACSSHSTIQISLGIDHMSAFGDFDLEFGCKNSPSHVGD
jgi:hypothetical protein